MKDHTFYIASSYGALLLAVLLELWTLRRHRGQAVDEARQAADEGDA